MLATESILIEENKFLLDSPPVKKIRTDSSSTSDSNLSVESTVRTLELEGVKELFQDYDLQDTEAVACVICGKNYKSKVCVKKHLWEHSVYWDLFDGLKKQQRVLSIQAAIILAIKFNPSLSLLLVTNSSSGQKKKSNQNNEKSSSDSMTTTTTTSSATSTHSRKRKLDETSNTKISSNVSYRSTVIKESSLGNSY